jgi:hypothetical protein
VERVVTVGVGYWSAADGPFGMVRLRHFGEYPLIEDNSTRSEPRELRVSLSWGL